MCTADWEEEDVSMERVSKGGFGKKSNWECSGVYKRVTMVNT